MTQHELPHTQDEQQEALFSERFILEGLDEESLNELQQMLLSRISDAERVVHLINDVKIGAGYEA